jgi:succinate dehydrogenase / fumarate reductase flavoprotein subunit
MRECCGVFRTQDKLAEGVERVKHLKERYRNITVMDKGDVYNMDLLAALELGHILSLAEVILISALKREESRGSHSRLDFTGRDDEKWMKHTLAYSGDEGLRIEYRDVTVTKYAPEERRY